MLDTQEIIGMQAQPGALFKIDGKTAEGQHLPVVVIRERHDAEVVVLRNNQNIAGFRFEGDQIDLMRRFPGGHEHYPAQFDVLRCMKGIHCGRRLQRQKRMQDGYVLRNVYFAAASGLPEQIGWAKRTWMDTHDSMGLQCKYTQSERIIYGFYGKS